MIGQWDVRFQALPVKARSRISFAARCNVLMAGHMLNRVVPKQVKTEPTELHILGVFEHITLQTFELDADRVVIALGAPSVFGLSGMPGTVIRADKLPKAAVTLDVEM